MGRVIEGEKEGWVRQDSESTFATEDCFRSSTYVLPYLRASLSEGVRWTKPSAKTICRVPGLHRSGFGGFQACLDTLCWYGLDMILIDQRALF